MASRRGTKRSSYHLEATRRQWENNLFKLQEGRERPQQVREKSMLKNASGHARTEQYITASGIWQPGGKGVTPFINNVKTIIRAASTRSSRVCEEQEGLSRLGRERGLGELRGDLNQGHSGGVRLAGRRQETRGSHNGGGETH